MLKYHNKWKIFPSIWVNMMEYFPYIKLLGSTRTYFKRL